MSEVKLIKITFENCEQIEFPRKNLGYFYIGGISTEIKRVASNSISKCLTTDEVAIEIYKEGNTDYYPFGFEENKTGKFDRIIEYDDITFIDIEYDNGLIESYYVNYEDEVKGSLGTPNVNQKSYISEYGNLYIVIAKDKNIEDYFDMKGYNNDNSSDTTCI